MTLYPEPANMTGVWDIFEYANQVTGSIFGIGIVVTFYITIFGYLKLKGELTTDCAMVAGFMSSIVAIFLFLGSLIEPNHLFICILLFALSALWGYFHKSG